MRARRRLGDGGGQAAEAQIPPQSGVEHRRIDTHLAQQRLAVAGAQLGDGQPRRGGDPAVDRARERGEALGKGEMVGARLAAPGEPLGGATLEIDRGGPGADHHLVTDRAAVPQRLDRCLPTRHGGHLVEQQQAARPVHQRAAIGEIQRPLDGRGQLREMPPLQKVEREIDDRPLWQTAVERPRDEQLQIGALADLARPAQNMDSRPL